MNSFPFSEYRSQFPILQNAIQLSSCSQSALSFKVKHAIQEYMDSWEQSGMDWGLWMDTVEASRKSFATLINADVEDICVTSSVSHAVSAIATSLNFSGNRNQVVLTEMDFPCIGHVWLSQEAGVPSVRFVPSEDGETHIPLDNYEKTINEKTLLTSISHVGYYNGFKQNLKQIADIAHRKGSYLFVDAYQSAGNVAIDVKESDVDFLAAGVQKYLLGIPGIAFLYIKREIADQLTPRVTGWFGQANPFAFDIKHAKYAQGARKFDSGTAPMINSFAAKAALDMILEVGMDNIESYLNELSSYSLQYALEKGMTVRSPLNLSEKASNTAIAVNNADQIEQIMKQKGIIVSARNDVIRIAPHFYNTREDIQTAIDVLATIR